MLRLHPFHMSFHPEGRALHFFLVIAEPDGCDAAGKLARNPGVLLLNQSSASGPTLLELSLCRPEEHEKADAELPALRRCQRAGLPAEVARVSESAVIALARRTEAELGEYLQGRRRAFELPLLLAGTPFRQRAWEQLSRIPYGQTRSYQEQAEACGNPRACRAIGMANYHNSLILLLPCHRVIGKDGKLGGYRPGTEYKEYFLQLEQYNSQ